MKKKVETTKESQARGPASFLTSQAGEDVIELIMRDHKPLKDLIKLLKDGDTKRSDKEAPFEKFVPLLVGHAKAEEQSLYVQMKEIKKLRTESFEGDTEHAIAEQLVHEINACPDDDEWNAKVKVVAELVEHHIQEEEGEILKHVEKQMDLSTRQKVGALYTQIKSELDTLSRPRSQSPQRSAEHRLN